MKYKKNNSFIQYFNKLHEKIRREKKVRIDHYSLSTPQLGWHPPNYETYALLNLDNTLLKLAKLEKMHT